MQLININPRLVEFNPWNVNEVDEENGIKLKNSIQRLGMFKPIIVRELGPKRYQVLGGAHRLEQAINLKLETIPAFNLGKVPEDRAKEISLIDNVKYGEDDDVKLGELLRSLGSPEELSEFIPFINDEILDSINAASIDFDALEEEVLKDMEEGIDEEIEERVKKVKTHEIIRFKVAISDAETIRTLLSKTKKSQGFKDADELTNDGDALTYLLLSKD